MILVCERLGQVLVTNRYRLVACPRGDRGRDLDQNGGGGMRRASVLTAVLLAAALSLVGCANDTGSTGSSARGTATDCKRNPAPTGGAAPAPPPVAAPGTDASALKVGVSFDVGGRGDASFNDAAAAGLDRTKSQLKVADTKELTAAVGESE